MRIKHSHAFTTESSVLWPLNVERRFCISKTTRQRWERDGHLPPRDLIIGPKSGWLLSTIVDFEQRLRGKTAA